MRITENADLLNIGYLFIEYAQCAAHRNRQWTHKK